MQTIRWGMIGCGDASPRSKWARLLQGRPFSQLVAVMRRNGALAADYAQRHGVSRWHGDADAILRAPDIDAVYVATLTDSHHDYVLRVRRRASPCTSKSPWR
jgi:predicted dehydrogenase